MGKKFSFIQINFLEALCFALISYQIDLEPLAGPEEDHVYAGVDCRYEGVLGGEPTKLSVRVRRSAKIHLWAVAAD